MHARLRLAVPEPAEVDERQPNVTVRAACRDVTNPSRAYDGFDSSRPHVPPDGRIDAFSRSHDDSGVRGGRDAHPLLVSPGGGGAA